MLNFVLCDDNASALDKLESMLNKIFTIKNMNAKVGFKSTIPYEIIDYVNENSTNVLVLDIDLKSSMSGLELAAQIRKQNKSIYIMFITGHPEYVFLGYQSKTFDFLLKPVTSERLTQTVERLVDDVLGSPKCFINIDKNSKTFIDNNDINYIKKDAMKLIYHTNHSQYETYNSFNKIEHLLPEYFVRCHKSYIVNINNIVDIRADNTIQFKNFDTCEIGPKYKNNLMEVIKNYGNFTNNLDSINNRK